MNEVKVKKIDQKLKELLGDFTNINNTYGDIGNIYYVGGYVRKLNNYDRLLEETEIIIKNKQLSLNKNLVRNPLL